MKASLLTRKISAGQGVNRAQHGTEKSNGKATEINRILFHLKVAKKLPLFFQEREAVPQEVHVFKL